MSLAFWCFQMGWFEILVNYRVKFFWIFWLETVQNDATPISWTAMMKLVFFLPAWCQDNLWDGILALFVSQLGQMASWTVVIFVISWTERNTHDFVRSIPNLSYILGVTFSKPPISLFVFPSCHASIKYKAWRRRVFHWEVTFVWLVTKELKEKFERELDPLFLRFITHVHGKMCSQYC